MCQIIEFNRKAPRYIVLVLSYQFGSGNCIEERVPVQNDERLSFLEIQGFFKDIIPLGDIDAARYQLPELYDIDAAPCAPCNIQITGVLCSDGISQGKSRSDLTLSNIMDLAAADSINRTFVY